MSPRTEALAALALAVLTAAASLAHAGCKGDPRTRYVAPLAPAPDPAPVEVRTPPAEATQGQLLNAHTAVVTVGVSPGDSEPYAPPGRWIETPRGAFLWLPSFAEAAGLLMPVVAEVDTTLPRHDLLFAPDPAWVGAKPGTRVVVLAGHFALGNRLVAGLTQWSGWHDPATKLDHDVLYVSWRTQAAGIYLPAYAHELAHSWSRSWLGEQ